MVTTMTSIAAILIEAAFNRRVGGGLAVAASLTSATELGAGCGPEFSAPYFADAILNSTNYHSTNKPRQTLTRKLTSTRCSDTF